MKGLQFTIFLFLCSLGTYAQNEEETAIPKNEIKGNVATVIFEFAELSYERILSPNIGVGVTGTYSISDDYFYKGMALPYFRFYPSERLKASGFFLEANTGVIFSEKIETGWQPYTYSFDEIEREYSPGFGFGIAVGGKFISAGGLFGEIFLGLGREFDESTAIEIYPRSGLNFGYRF